MTLRVLVACAHADDETLGCGGTLLKHRAAGDDLGWILATSPGEDVVGREFVERRRRDVRTVAEAYGMGFVRELGFPAARLDGVALTDIISPLAEAMSLFRPDIVYLVHGGDVHSDHRVVAEAAWAALKPVRGVSSARRVLAFETLSSTNLAAPAAQPPFVPNAYCDVSRHLDRKIDILRTYQTELLPSPSARSAEAVEALARYRGSAVHVPYAEAFMVLRDHF